MKLVDKYKKKLKIWKWCNKHFGNTLLLVYVPSMVLSWVLMIFAPMAGAIMQIGALSTLVVGGIVHLSYADNSEYGLILEKKIAAMENVTERSVEVLEDNIEYYKQNPTQFKDAKSTKNLVRELIKIKKCAEKALEEQKDDNNELTNSL